MSAFQLLLFSTDPAFIVRAGEGGVAGIVIDWVHIGKLERQASFDTQINHDTLEDLRRVRACTDRLVICRINGFGQRTAEGVEEALDAGADEILLPMVRTVEEVEAVLGFARGRAGVGILVETEDAVARIGSLGRLPLSRVYVGLNDLAIDRGSPSLFTAVADGTVERVRRHVAVPFGFAGLTIPEGGQPIPCRLLVAEMVRLACDFTFLRRSFYRDLDGRDPAREIPRILQTVRDAGTRSPQDVDGDRAELLLRIESWPNELPELWPVPSPSHGRAPG
jgi:hypothetical protein